MWLVYVIASRALAAKQSPSSLREIASGKNRSRNDIFRPFCVAFFTCDCPSQGKPGCFESGAVDNIGDLARLLSHVEMGDIPVSI
jgi:hypothetical protein